MYPTPCRPRYSIRRYNTLLLAVRRQLADLKKALKGLVVVTPELEEISQALLQGKVNASWTILKKTMKIEASRERTNRAPSHATRTKDKALYVLSS